MYVRVNYKFEIFEYACYIYFVTDRLKFPPEGLITSLFNVFSLLYSISNLLLYLIVNFEWLHIYVLDIHVYDFFVLFYVYDIILTIFWNNNNNITFSTK